MTDWSNYKSKIPAGGNGDLMKLEDGKPVKVRVVGEPWVVASEYKGQPSTRFVIKFWNQTAKAAQFTMLPKTAINMILDLAENPDWGDPTMYDLTIMRTGTGKETEYSIIPSPTKVILASEKQQEVEALDLEAILARFPSISFAMPLAETDDEFWQKTKALPAAAVAEDGDNKAAVDHVIEDDGEPIKLGDIPF